MIYLLFPIVSSIFFGLGYALTERVATFISLHSYVVLNGIANIVVALLISYFHHNSEPVGFAFLQEKASIIFMVLLAAFSPAIGWMFTIYSVQNISAVYTAFGQVSYPIFTLLFVFLLFGQKNFDIYTLIGGSLAIIGTAILVYGKSIEQNP